MHAGREIRFFIAGVTPMRFAWCVSVIYQELNRADIFGFFTFGPGRTKCRGLGRRGHGGSAAETHAEARLLLESAAVFR
jgi:hypothetical protein